MSQVERHAQSRLLEATARRLGVRVLDMSEAWGRDAMVYEHGGRRRTVLLGRQDASLSQVAYALTVDKWAAKQILLDAGVETPRAAAFRFDPNTHARDGGRAGLIATLAREIVTGGTWVLKPRFGEYGRGVGMGVGRVEDALYHLALHGADWPDWLLEREVEGQDLRIQAIAGALVAACVRAPASMTGDGARSVRALIAARDEEARAPNPNNRCLVDAETMEVLADQDLALDDVPEAGRAVRLKATANLSKGGRAIDVTDALHPSYAKLVETVANAFELEFFALDLIAPDIAAPASEAAVIEVNAEPDWLHHTFSDGRRHDIAEQYLRFLLPSLEA